MHDQTVRISDWYRGSENILRISMPPAAAVVMALVIGVSGCAQQQQHVPGEGSENVRVSPPASQATDGAAAQEVTVEAFQALLAKWKGHPVIVCIWSAESPEAVPALSEALQWQAQREGSALLGICLDPADAWAAKAVPVLRKVGPPLACVTIAPGHQRQVLALCGVSQVPEAARIVLLDEAGRPISPAGGLLAIPEVPPPAAASGPSTQAAEEVPATQIAAEAPAKGVTEGAPAMAVAREAPAMQIAQDASAVPPAGTEHAGAGSEHAATGVPAEQVARAELPATRPANGGNATVLLLYSLQLVRLSDSTKVAEPRGTVVWQDVASAGGKAGKEGLALRRLGLGRLGQEIALKVSHEGAVGICPLRGVGGGDGNSNLAEAFAEGLATAIQEAGGKAVPPREVSHALKQIGMESSAVVLQSGALKASLKATFLLTGTVTVSKLERGPK